MLSPFNPEQQVNNRHGPNQKGNPCGKQRDLANPDIAITLPAVRALARTQVMVPVGTFLIALWP